MVQDWSQEAQKHYDVFKKFKEKARALLPFIFKISETYVLGGIGSVCEILILL